MSLNDAREELKIGGDRELAWLLIQLDLAESLRYLCRQVELLTDAVQRGQG